MRPGEVVFTLFIAITHHSDITRFAPTQERHMMTGCWAADPSLRPGFDSLVIQPGGYMSRTDRQSYDARSRLDSGLGRV